MLPSGRQSRWRQCTMNNGNGIDDDDNDSFRNVWTNKCVYALRIPGTDCVPCIHGSSCLKCNFESGIEIATSMCCQAMRLLFEPRDAFRRSPNSLLWSDTETIIIIIGSHTNRAHNWQLTRIHLNMKVNHIYSDRCIVISKTKAQSIALNSTCTMYKTNYNYILLLDRIHSEAFYQSEYIHIEPRTANRLSILHIKSDEFFFFISFNYCAEPRVESF